MLIFYSLYSKNIYETRPLNPISFPGGIRNIAQGRRGYYNDYFTYASQGQIVFVLEHRPIPIGDGIILSSFRFSF